MKLALVTAFPPSRKGLNEYGFHVADELRQHRGLELTILADYLPEPRPELPEFSVERCWGFNRLSNPLSVLRAVHRLKPDVVWYNIGFASFGGKPLPAFFGLTTPALTRFCLVLHTHYLASAVRDRRPGRRRSKVSDAISDRGAPGHTPALVREFFVRLATCVPPNLTATSMDAAP